MTDEEFLCPDTMHINKLEKENKRLREALEKISKFPYGVISSMPMDIALKALKENDDAD